MRIPVAKPKLISNDNLKINDLIKKTINYIKHHYKDKNIYINQTAKNKPIKICLDWNDLKDDLRHRHFLYREKLYSFTVIREIIAGAKYMDSEPDKDGNELVTIHNFVGNVQIEGVFYHVWIKIKESGKTFIYDHAIIIK